MYDTSCPPEDLYLHVEHQTIHRLDQNPEYVLFTVRIHADKLESLSNDHLNQNAKIDIGSCACGVLASHIRTLLPERLEYKGLQNE